MNKYKDRKIDMKWVNRQIIRQKERCIVSWIDIKLAIIIT